MANGPTGEIHALAPSPQQALERRHRFVASGDRGLPARLLSEHIVFRSPFVQAPIPGRPATALVLTTSVQIFENFRYHRTFIGPRDAALEFAANIGKWQLSGGPALIFALFEGLQAGPRACAGEGLVARIGALCWAFFGRFSRPGHAAVAQW